MEVLGKFHQKTSPQSQSHYQGINKNQHICKKKEKTGKALLVLFFRTFSW